MRRLPEGASIQRDSQTSPITFAKEVMISAKITSQKRIASFAGGIKHLRRELMIMNVRYGIYWNRNSYLQKKGISFAPLKVARWSS